ncbi:hypothetical protein Tco_0309367 [Tanacetum coccineum]
MADLTFNNQHNMVACLEKTDRNAEFHEIIDFLTSNSIHYALTISPTIYASYIEQFWNTATSQTVNDVKHIHATVDRKAVVITEASVRSSLLFNDVEAHTLKVFSNMSRQGQKFSGRATPLFPSMLAQQAVAEGEGSGHPPEPQPTPSPTQTIIESQILVTESSPQNTQSLRQALHEHTELPQTSVPFPNVADKTVHQELGDRMVRDATTVSLDAQQDSVNTVGSGEDSMEPDYELTVNVPPTPHDSPLSGAKTTQDKVITRLKLRVRRLEKKRKARTPQPMKRRLFKGRVETSTNISLGEDASKQGMNDDKTEELNLIDGANTEVIVEDKGSGEKGGSTADQVSTARPEVSAATPSTPPTTTNVFYDEDLTIAQTLVKMRSEKAKEKRSCFQRCKGVLVEEEPEKLEKVKRRDQGLAQFESDAELAQRLHEEELAELDRARKERQKQEEATNAALAEEFDEIQARMDADHELAVRLTLEEQEKYTIKDRARF